MILNESIKKFQLGYCGLIWVFHKRNFRTQSNDWYEMCLRIFFGNFEPTFQELLKLNNFVSIYHDNIRPLRTKLHKRKNLSNHTISELSDLRNIVAVYITNYGLRYLNYICLEGLEYSSKGC